MYIVIKPTEQVVKASEYIARCQAKRDHEACRLLDRRDKLIVAAWITFASMVILNVFVRFMAAIGGF